VQIAFTFFKALWDPILSERYLHYMHFILSSVKMAWWRSIDWNKIKTKLYCCDWLKPETILLFFGLITQWVVLLKKNWRSVERRNFFFLALNIHSVAPWSLPPTAATPFAPLTAHTLATPLLLLVYTEYLY